MSEISREKAFYFFTSIGNYTGESARSLEEFLQKVKDINSESLEFHLYRNDFQRWIRDVLANEELAEELHKITRLNIKGESLRTTIFNVEESVREYPPIPKEHAYELKMEKRIKRLLDEQKKKP
jgi:hypothetical protein